MSNPVISSVGNFDISNIPRASFLNVADSYLCNSYYGDGLVADDCRSAAGALPFGTGTEPIWFATDPRNPRIETALPIYRTSPGHCTIAIEVAGPALPSYVPLIPYQIRYIANYVINKCVVERGGIGGFMTQGLERSYTCLTNTQHIISEGFPISSYFITVSVGYAMSIGDRPGNTDPAIPNAMSKFLKLLPAQGDPSGIIHMNLQMLSYQAQRMKRGGTLEWWDFSSAAPDEMAYECDAGLGNPSAADCSNIQWHQLPAPSDTLSVSPGTTTFLHHNTCYLAISATVSLVLSWAQISTALATLMNTCIERLDQGSQGGRAFYSASATPKRNIERRKAQSRSPNGLTGWNALPPHTNITLFQQKEPWSNPAAEAKTCTWKAVTSGANVTTCQN